MDTASLQSTLRTLKLEGMARSAKLRDTEANIASIDYTTNRRLDETKFRELAKCDWIRENNSVLITGPCGVGKSYLACALGHEACRQEKSVLYFRMPRFFSELEASHKSETYERWKS